MKKFTTILLLTVIMLQTFSSFVIRAGYFINKNYIASVLCINKNKPELHCNGKCYLTKQLTEQEKKEQQAPNLKRDKFEVQLFFLPKQLQIAGVPSATSVTYYDTADGIRSAILRSVFHPPTV